MNSTKIETSIINNREFVELIGKVVIIFLSYQEKPLHGRLLKETTNFITIKMKAGRVIHLAKNTIVSLRDTWYQPPADEVV